MQRNIVLLLILFFYSYSCIFSSPVVNRINLNGKWLVGEGRSYDSIAKVPGIVTNPKKMNDMPLWYKKEIELPGREWSYATLTLKGARFAPTVYINGDKVSYEEGGMAPTVHLLKHKAVKPGNTVKIEIELESLKNIPETDASYIPVADHWRSNISSCLWDDVILQTHNDLKLKRIIPATDFNNRKLTIDFIIENLSIETEKPDVIVAEITDDGGNVLAEGSCDANDVSNNKGSILKNKYLRYV